MGKVTVQRATQLYGILAAVGRLNASEQAELDEYAERFKKGKFEPCV